MEPSMVQRPPGPKAATLKMAWTSLYPLLGCSCHDYHCRISSFDLSYLILSRGKLIGCSLVVYGCSMASSWHICALRSGMFMGSSGV